MLWVRLGALCNLLGKVLAAIPSNRTMSGNNCNNKKLEKSGATVARHIVKPVANACERGLFTDPALDVSVP